MFLESRGYESEFASDDVKDGHWLLKQCAVTRASTCSHCHEPFLRHLFLCLESGQYILGDGDNEQFSEWSREDTKSVLQAGGFAIDMEAQ